MAAYPRTITNGAGEELTFLGVVGGPDHHRLDAESRAHPGAGPPMHVHHRQEEAMTVVTGGWVKPPHNLEYFLTALFDATRRNGRGRPGLYDAAFLMTRYRSEFGNRAVPAPVQTLVFPLVVLLGRILGRYDHFRGAPTPLA